MLPLRDRVDQGVMAMKGYSSFLKAPALLEPHHQIFLMSYPGHLLVVGSYLSAEIHSVYSTAPADWACVTEESDNTCIKYNLLRFYNPKWTESKREECEEDVKLHVGGWQVQIFGERLH